MLTEALRRPVPTLTFHSLGNDQMQALRQLSSIFKSTIPDDNDTAIADLSARPVRLPLIPHIPPRVPLCTTPSTQAPLPTPPRVQTAHLTPLRMPVESTDTPQGCALPPLLPYPNRFPSVTSTNPHPPDRGHYPNLIDPDADDPFMHRYPLRSQQ